MPDFRVGTLLDNLPELQPLKLELTRLTALQNALMDVIPSSLSTNTNVASLKAGELVIFADNGAVAAKLKQIGPRILLSLCQRGYELTAINIQVQVRTRYNPLPHKQISLSSSGLAAISLLADKIKPSSLKDALLRLARRRS